MIPTVYLTQEELNRILTYKIGSLGERYGVKLTVAFDLQQSTYELFDIKLNVEDEKGLLSFEQPLKDAELKLFEEVTSLIAKSLKYIEGDVTVLLWVQAGEYSLTYSRKHKAKSVISHIDIVFDKGRNWTLLELFQIQNWASTAEAGMHSKSATGMSVGGRRFRWITELGFSVEETETLCRLNLGQNGLKKSGGVYVGNPNVEPLDDDDDE